MNQTKDYINTNLLKFLAIFLIINSHMSHYYPIASFGSGGSLGNAIFFMLSAYGLLFSFRKKNKTFNDYYIHRVKRLYSPIWVALTFMILPISFYFGEFETKELLTWVGFYFYPPFWFIQILLFYYFVGFFLMYKYSDQRFFKFLFVSLIIYIINYFSLDFTNFSLESVPFRFIFYFIVFIYGFYIANNFYKIYYKGYKDILILFVLFICYLIFKLIIGKGYLVEIQFVIHILTISIIFYLFKINNSSYIQSFMKSNKYISRQINYLGGITLEIYIVHAILFNHIFPRLDFNFPINVIMSFILAFLLASILSLLTQSIQRKILIINLKKEKNVP